ncbi:MAG: YggT family protein [Cellulomonas sp.]
MRLVAGALSLVVTLFIVALLARMVVDWVQFFARDWRPRGVVLVLTESVYTVTDPPLRALRRLLPPLTLGTMRLDLAFTVLLLLCWFVLLLLSVLGS